MSIKKGLIYIFTNSFDESIKSNDSKIVLALEDETKITWSNGARYSSADDLVTVLENDKISYAWVHDLELIGE